MGKRCTRYAALGEPQSLRRRSTSEVCDKCAQAGFQPEELLNAVSSQGAGGLRVLRRNDKYCLFCGNYWDQLRTWGQIHEIQDSDQPLYFCKECAALVKRGWAMNDLLFVWEIGSAVPLEERFGGLFRAARALLREGAHEDRVLPTLAVEGLEIHAGRDQEPWSQEAADFYLDHPRVRPVSLEDGVLILERRKADVEVRLEGDTVILSAAPRPKPPTPLEVATAYEQFMTSKDLPHDIEYKLSLDVVEASYILYLRLAPIQPLSRGQGRQVNYPSPERVVDVYRGLLGGSLGKRLEMRAAGSDARNRKNLVLAIVAFYLRTYGGLQGRKKIHRLLNEHVLCEEQWKLPEDGQTDTLTKQLWDGGVKRYHKHLVREMFAL